MNTTCILVETNSGHIYAIDCAKLKKTPAAMISIRNGNDHRRQPASYTCTMIVYQAGALPTYGQRTEITGTAATPSTAYDAAIEALENLDE